MCKKAFENFSNSLKENEYFNIFNVIVLPILCFLSILTAFNGVKNYLRFDVVSQTRVIEQVINTYWLFKNKVYSFLIYSFTKLDTSSFPSRNHM